MTGRPVRARMLVLPGTGADASWFQITGESERMIPVAGAATVDVSAKVPEKVAAGSFSFALGAALEEAPDQVVSSPTVVFDVPDREKPRFRWWIVAIVVGALIILAVGGWLIYAFTQPPSDPTLKQAPTISGAAESGSVLTVGPGVWDPDDVVRIYAWQVCPDTASDENDAECEDILVGAGEAAEGAGGSTFVVGAEELVGQRIRVVETAVRVDLEEFGEEGPDDLSGFPQSSAPSSLTDPVEEAEPTTALVPGVVGLTYGVAQDLLAQAGFQIRREILAGTPVCSPKVEDQDPDAGVSATKGTEVEVRIKDRPPVTSCWTIVTDDDVVIMDDWLPERVGP
ncbi:PASTA domain-containing protein [Microbacterium sp. DT81.1]|uniref:PASTA domain-containing protein n=1 Tax=Microbacterium sp. DT81.1 TaxID=3393413 RepID=UPI003CE76BEB